MPLATALAGTEHNHTVLGTTGNTADERRPLRLQAHSRQSGGRRSCRSWWTAWGRPGCRCAAAAACTAASRTWKAHRRRPGLASTGRRPRRFHVHPRPLDSCTAVLMSACHVLRSHTSSDLNCRCDVSLPCSTVAAGWPSLLTCMRASASPERLSLCDVCANGRGCAECESVV